MSDIKEFLRGIVLSLLTFEAKAVLKKYKPKVIAVTGSVGKTSSKDAVYTALSGSFFVRKSEKSFNSDIGVPLTILGVPNGWGSPFVWIKNLIEGATLLVLSAPYPEWLVIEVGADRPGDITRALSWLSPDAVLATRFPDIPVHVEFYKSGDDVAKEELAPVSWLTPGGVCVVNADDARAAAAVVPDGVKKFSYGFSSEADIRGMRYLVTSKNGMPTGIAFDVTHGDEKAHLNLPGVVGKTHAISMLAGIATASAIGVPLGVAAARFENHVSPSGRTRLIAGKNGSVIIDDSYNASPVAVEEALKMLSDIPRPEGGRRVAVLADMLELGSHSVAEHARIGTIAASSSDILMTVGIRTKGAAHAARDSGMPAENIFEFDHGEEAVSALLPMIGAGDVVLIKGSQSMRMERVVKALMQEPKDASKLLVRQDSEWLNR